MRMSKLLFTFPLLTFAATVSAQVSEKGAWVSQEQYGATGVTNEGIAVVSGDQNSPRYLWNPFTDEYTYIGGISAGNGVGGVGRISENGKYVVSTQEFDRIEIPNDWEATDLSMVVGEMDFTRLVLPMASKNGLFALGSSPDRTKGWILSTVNGGKTWKANDAIPPTEGFGGLICMGFRTLRRGHAAGYDGCFYSTTNGGVSWYAEDPHPADNTDEVYAYRVIDFTMDQPGGAGMPLAGIIGLELADHTGAVWYTEDFSNYSVAEGVKGIPMYGTHIGTTYFIVTDNGYIQKSVDNGKTWTSVLEPQTGPSPWSSDAPAFRRITFVSDGNIGFAVGNGGIYVTRDSGDTWEKVTAPATADWKSVSVNDSEVVAVLGGDRIYTSDNLGETWNAVSMEDMETAGINDIYFTDEYISALADNGTTLYRANSDFASGMCAAVYDIENDEWTQLPTLGIFSAGVASNPQYLTGNGSVVAGNVYRSETVDGVFYTASNAAVWIDGELNLLPNKFFYENRAAMACAASFDGSVVVGWQDFAGPWMASVWRRNADGTYTQRIMTKDPELTEDDILFEMTPEGYQDRSEKVLGQANAVSPDGKIIGGQGYDEYFASSGAWIWSEEKGYRELTDDGYMVCDMNNDGSVVIGYSKFGGGAWIWTEEVGFKSLEEYLTERGNCPECGVFGVMDMSPNGRYICGYGYIGTGVSMHPAAYVVDLFAEFSGVEKVEAQTKVTVYPNPVADELHIDLPFDEVETSLSLYDMQGMEVRKIAKASTSNVMNVSDLQKGMYLLVTDAQGMKKTTKVVVTH